MLWVLRLAHVSHSPDFAGLGQLDPQQRELSRNVPFVLPGERMWSFAMAVLITAPQCDPYTLHEVN